MLFAHVQGMDVNSGRAPSATSDVLRRGSILTYTAPDSAKDRKADHAANFDNFTIEVAAE